MRLKYFPPLRLCVKKIFLLIVLSGCMMGPNYHRPCLDIPDTFYESEGGSEGILDRSWWEDFEEPVLDDMIAEALINNKNLKIAAGNIETAAGIFMQARAPLFPQWGYGGSYTRLKQSQLNATPAVPPNPQSNWQLNENLSWELDVWGRVRRLTESAQASFFATIEARENVILSLIASVANGYLQLLGLDAQLIVTKETQTSYENALKYFELQYEHGQVSYMTVAQAKVQYEIATASIPQIELQIAQAEHALSVLLGRNPGPIVRGKPIYKLKMPEIPAELPSSLLERRPDILQAEQNLVAANAQIGAAKALYFPAINLTGAYGVSSQNLSDLFKGPARTWNYTGSITGPIFTWGLIEGQVEEAEGQTMAALYNYELVIQKAFKEVEDALIAHTKLEEKFAAQQKLVEASREYVYLSKLQYDGGYSPYFVVLQAEQQLFPSELSWIQTRVALFSSCVDIYQSMGGGL